MSSRAGQMDYDLVTDATVAWGVKASNPTPGKSLMDRIREQRLGRADFERGAA